jgi:hypothetical protein
MEKDRLLSNLQMMVERQVFDCLKNRADASEILDRVSRGIDRGAFRFQVSEREKANAA